jgi:hypothetical protein
MNAKRGDYGTHRGTARKDLCAHDIDFLFDSNDLLSVLVGRARLDRQLDP